LVSGKPSEKMVVMGRIIAPFGVKGWVKIVPATAEPDALQKYKQWWLNDGTRWVAADLESSSIRGKALVALLRGIADREAAQKLKGVQIGVPSSELPIPGENEFYWRDLIGLKVANRNHYNFGRVTRILETGANDVLVVIDGNRETLIPFIANAVKWVDLEAGEITVDWEPNY
jgi:16S rRNA processing protein RimM